MLTDWIPLVLSNFGLALLVVALVLIIIEWLIQVVCRTHVSAYEIIYRWVVLLPLGATAIYAFVMHAFFPDLTASTIGWQGSPFQFEVAMADLGFGVIAILSFKASFGFRLATVIGNTFWLWGDAVGHIYQMIAKHDYAIGNAGSWFWMDILIPLILIICIAKLKSRMVA